MVRITFHSLIIVFLTLLTQLGGLAWLFAICFRQRVLVFAVAYVALSTSALVVAPMFGREPIPCFSEDTFRMKSTLYCALNRQYVTPELEAVLQDFSIAMSDEFPQTTTLVLDANFPFISGFPLLPHLSHDDGRKVDLAFFYRNDGGFLPNVTRSPIGYFAFEDGPTDCPENMFTLRWNFSWLQRLWPDYHLEPRRMAMALQLLSADERVGKVFIEPHLASRFQAQSSKIRFQGCRAARHDDHIHLQL
ncbi:hypothetical protein SAMN05444287_1615 [Octadecabacter temperatus]|uniref:Uncharacterized protein n=1 Tax=Octadecabacter temperatus TaxID=1458307 RepID=A0A0K0Y6A3_9RHOB|nr:hypothetical protein [Octadecabacter temperatus]AKS46499.1 hypothetical protein OSB_19590 [Octadecabacter temperatus]SIO15269.1 hypothetical protein SAMN05444287_1615 [Octadecabacter temperatus]